MAEGLTDLAKVREDLVWGTYADVRMHARHAEVLRTNVVNFMIVVASVLVAAIANDGAVKRSDVLLCAAIGQVGLVGLAFAASYTELFERNRNRAVRFGDQLDQEFLEEGPVILSTTDAEPGDD